ncbi:MAG: TetR/AcrR family transcriptional regulator C-terminal domain-containing protein [Acidimicrobiia bacterium]|nr:TetR/AcrR family transcriptional regulator C-terminal domain-containing protein [Acidimicrobiia bacterium]
MVTEQETTARTRVPLSKDRVLRAAVALADASGIEAVTMRKLAAELDVEAMSLYYHVANKEQLLDGMVDVVISEIEDECGGFAVPDNVEWKVALRTRIMTARAVMLRHRWAPELLETRTNMSARLVRYFDTVLGIMIEGGFSYDLGHHAMHALGSRVLGFNQELFKPDNDRQEEESNEMLAAMAEQLPYIVTMMQEITHEDPESTLGWCDDQAEFEFGIDLMLDGLERLRG